MWEQYTVTLQRVSPSAPKHTRPHLIYSLSILAITAWVVKSSASQEGDLNYLTCCSQLIVKKARRAQITDVADSPLSAEREPE